MEVGLNGIEEMNRENLNKFMKDMSTPDGLWFQAAEAFSQPELKEIIKGDILLQSVVKRLYKQVRMGKIR